MATGSAQAQVESVVPIDSVLTHWHVAEGTPGPLVAVIYVPAPAGSSREADRRVTVLYNRSAMPAAWRATWGAATQIHVPAYGTVTVAAAGRTEEELRKQQPYYDEAVALMARIEAQIRAAHHPDDSRDG